MIIYHTSHRTSLLNADGSMIECPYRVCRTRGKNYPHVCFTREPVSGHGPFAHSVDISESEISHNAFENDFSMDDRTWFAIPSNVVAKHLGSMKHESFEAVTGNPWNSWVIPMLDRRAPKDPKSRLLGDWAVIWVSRKGVASAKIHHKEQDDEGVYYMSVEVTTTIDFDPIRDYIVVERHEEFEREDHSGIKETWKVQLLAGVEPQWMVYPLAWKNWVWDKTVLRSAINYIVNVCPDARPLIMLAQQKSTKQNTARAWREVSQKISVFLTECLKTRKDLGVLPAHSWTAVAAMPHRIAMRLSQHVNLLTPALPPWEPPIPKPEFENPETSGRVALANLYGAYPKHGPGVDHAPQDRPYDGLEGEFDSNTGPFGEPAQRPTPAVAGV